MRILVLPGDGIGPEITAATLSVLEAADDSLRARAAHRGARRSAWRPWPPRARPSPTTCSRGWPRSTARSSARSRTTTTRRAPRAASTRRPSCAPASSSTRTCGRAGRSTTSACCARRWTSSSCARTPRASTPTAACMPARESSCPTPTPRSPSARSPRARRRRVARAAFEIARTRRGHVTAVHKANVLKLSDGLFLREVRRVAEDYPDVELRELIVDAAAARLIRDPGGFDVIVTTNMFGDILSDEASELCGSLGLGGAINAGDDICVAQAQHGSAPDIAGRGIANPVSLIRSAAMLLDWHGVRSGRPRARRGGRGDRGSRHRRGRRPHHPHSRPRRHPEHRRDRRCRSRRQCRSPRSPAEPTTLREDSHA